MSAFKALNIESDDESDVEIDDTKEIQIEEALKLYQNALKFHSEGPPSFDKAAEAYRQLFDSDIFKYPESQTELKRIELYGPAPEDDTVFEDVALGSKVVTNSFDTGPSTLPQILHLSHKNYAQFKLDALSAQFDSFNVTLNQILADALIAVNHFVEALDKDESDLDLWRRTATVGEILDSKRIARFCLESVLDGDDENLFGVMSLPGLEEGFAGEQLRELVAQLQDQLSMLQGPLTAPRRRVLSQMLKQRLHPYHDALEKISALRCASSTGQNLATNDKVVLKAPSSWAGLGDILLRQQMAERNGTSRSPTVAIGFDLSGTLPPPPPAKQIGRPLSPKVIIPRVVFPKKTTYPQTLSEQFPGSDKGKPTVQPQISSADASMQISADVQLDENADMNESSTMTLPSRKRSGDAAGIHDNEEGRTKSKRLRARDSNVDAVADRQAMLDANTRWEYEQQLNEIQAADDWMFETVGGLFERIGVVDFDAPRKVRHDMQSANNATSSQDQPVESLQALRHARSDIQNLLDHWNESMVQLLLHGEENLDLGQSLNLASATNMFASGGSSKVTKHVDPLPEDGVPELLETINEGWVLTEDAAWLFLDALLRPGKFLPEHNTYTQYQWSENLKTMVVRILVNFDETVLENASAELEAWKRDWSHGLEAPLLDNLAEVIESIFELHLDIYCLIKQTNSGVDADTISTQGYRLQRWYELARETMQYRAGATEEPDVSDTLNLRFLWATTFNISASAGVEQDHIIECMNDLRRIFVAATEPTLQLQNNAIMPELSVAALDREQAKLTTKEFFLKVTNQDLSSPAAVIENLEPLLKSLDTVKSTPNQSPGSARSSPPAQIAPELVNFLQASPISVRLLLWQRLRDAYVKIEYDPMVVCCYLHMIGMVLEELKSPEVTALPPSDRSITEMKSLRLVLNLTKKMFDVMQSSSEALDCIDGEYLIFAVSNLGEVLQLLQVFNVAEDSVRVGQSQPPSLPNGMPVTSFRSVLISVREAQVRIWIMLYNLFREAISQNKDLYTTPLEDRFDFLRTVHRNLGIRGICNFLNKAFVRMLKDEFFKMTHVDGYDSEQAQVLYDLHGLNCFLNPSYELIEHECTKDAFLDRGIALQAVDLLLVQADRLPMKELIKHPLRETIERVHGQLVRKKPSEAILRNREFVRAFLKSPINPLDLYNCLKGEGNQLPATQVPDSDAILASKGWYFLMGHMSLTKFRSQKKTGPSATEDVDIAIAFFMQDLEYTMDHWETWFRLAQAYDTKIEESVVWSAEKLNSNMADLVTLQKNAIHCFTMATALAYRSADLQFETSSKMTELYADFALRLYATSREPFGMKPFQMVDTEVFISRPQGGIGKTLPVQPLRAYTAWKLAQTLFKRAIVGRADQWQLHYMVGKCLWKMHNSTARFVHDVKPTGQQVLDALVKALEHLPEKDRKEGKDSKREPLLEPHYKLLSVTHKLIFRGSITLTQAQQALEHSHYARKEAFPEDMDSWLPYALAVLKNLRAADKSNWYHRMIARHANIVYHEDPATAYKDTGALAAKEVLTQQMFTKTMVQQVWRPENERAGRHFVYTARYTRLFVNILTQLKDRNGLEMLARRVRRRPHDLFEHSAIWQEICTAYLQLLREHASLQEGLETSTFSNIAHDEFTEIKAPLEAWMQTQTSGTSSTLDVLREVQELKKINQGLMKPGVIDDLIGDAYAYLFNTVGKQLWDQQQRAKQQEEAQKSSEPPPVASPQRNPMMSLTHLMNVDGAGGAASVTHSAPIPSTTEPRDQEAPVRRKIGVGRREIRTCAESCVQKPGASSSTTTTKSQPGGPAKSLASNLVDEERGNASSGVVSTESAPGSAHEDENADDESELSELEDEEGARDDVDEADDEAEEEEGHVLKNGISGAREGDEAGEVEGNGKQDDVEMQYGP